MRIKLLVKLLNYLKKYSIFYTFGILLITIGIVSNLYITIFIGKAIDLVSNIQENYFNDIRNIVMSIILLAIVGFISQWGGQWLINHGLLKIIKSLREDIIYKFTYGKLSDINQFSKGALLNYYLVDVETVSDGLLGGCYQLISGLLTMIITLVFMFKTYLPMALVVLILTPLSIKVASFISKGAYRFFQSQSQLRAQLTTLTSERINEWECVDFFDLKEDTVRRFGLINDQWHKDGKWAMFYASLVNPTARMMNTVIYGILGVWGAFKVLSGRIQLGDLAIFLGYAKQYAKPFNEMTSIFAEFQQALASWEKIQNVLELKNEMDLGHIHYNPAKHGETLSGRRVFFGYDSENMILKDINFTVKKGESLALIGTTGCGKSTLLSLILQFYKADLGEITLGKYPLNNYLRKSLGSYRGVVLQTPWTFYGTVFENISFGRSSTKEEVIQAAKAAYAHDFIMKLPNKYDEKIGKLGHQLSAGEQQLICIARVMLWQPSLLILDEATSHLDTLTESLIQKNVESLMQNKTTIIVAHRLETIKKANCILVMKDGQIIEYGNHEKLIKKQGLYSRLYNQLR